MSENSYAIAFKGEVAEGYDAAQVKANLAKMFKTTTAHIDKLFTGKPVALKKGLDESTAQKYQAALKQAGAVTYVVNTAKSEAQAVPAPARAAPAEAPAQPASGESGFLKYTVKEAPRNLDAFAGISIDAPGTVLVEHQEVPAAVIDTRGLDMAERGARLAEAEEVPPLDVNTDRLSMAEAGVVLVEPEEVKPLEIDTSRLSMD